MKSVKAFVPIFEQKLKLDFIGYIERKYQLNGKIIHSKYTKSQ